MAPHRRAARPARAPATERPQGPLSVTTVERVVAGGDGLGRDHDGRVLFVPGALPGELVEVRVVQSRRDFARGELVRVLEPSAARIEPPCPARRRGCGGCDWQHVDPSAQLDLKVDIVREALRRTARMPDAAVARGGSVPPWSYRTSMRFSVAGDGRPSLRRARSNDDIALDGCPVAHPALASMLPGLRLRGADEVSLRVSASTGERTAWWQAAGAVVTGLPDDVMTGDGAHLSERVARADLRVSAGSFFQSGPAAASLLVETVRDVGGSELLDAKLVVDAYGGVGLFAATVVPVGARVLLVEGSSSACADARVNLAGRDATVVESSVEASGDAWPLLGGARNADVVIADPSRQGLGAEAVDALAVVGAGVLVLVSCDPVAFARDAALLGAAGYEHQGSTVLDLFPQTHHVEVVSRFVRAGVG